VIFQPVENRHLIFSYFTLAAFAVTWSGGQELGSGCGPALPKARFDENEKAAKIANTTNTINGARSRAFIWGTLLFSFFGLLKSSKTFVTFDPWWAF
jgi:hypothetical protein